MAEMPLPIRRVQNTKIPARPNATLYTYIHFLSCFTRVRAFVQSFFFLCTNWSPFWSLLSHWWMEDCNITGSIFFCVTKFPATSIRFRSQRYGKTNSKSV